MTEGHRRTRSEDSFSLMPDADREKILVLLKDVKDGQDQLREEMTGYKRKTDSRLEAVERIMVALERAVLSLERQALESRSLGLKIESMSERVAGLQQHLMQAQQVDVVTARQIAELQVKWAQQAALSGTEAGAAAGTAAGSAAGSKIGRKWTVVSMLCAILIPPISQELRACSSGHSVEVGSP